MRILQEHVDFIEYQPVEKEIPEAETTEKKLFRVEEALVLFAAVEEGDNDEMVGKAVAEVADFLKKLKVNRVVIYPYAHLSQNLARAGIALDLLKKMEAQTKTRGIETFRAPFGWNKALQVKVKGHPLAEQSRNYSSEVVAIKQERAPQVSRGEELTEEEMFARIKKSDFVGLPDTDHRVIGEKLDLFSFQEPSPGMVYWHNDGVKLRNLLIDFIRRELAKRKYIEISTPSLANTVLWKVSGHWEHYKDNMFLTNLGEEQFGLKPMNCPSTMLYYRTRRWSFRDFPLRVADFDALYRNELSGVATGLFRVKMLTQDDAHIFVTEEQVEEEITDLIDLLAKMYVVFSLSYRLKISTMPDDHIGNKEQWDAATEMLERVAKKKGLQYEIKERQGAFYGPKIDADVKDSMGREWQCATIQLDYQLPRRFRLTYVGSDGKDHAPVVIHRVIYGSLERFIGIIIEHFQGKFPVWVSPIQVTVLPISDDNKDYAETVVKRLQEASVRVNCDLESATIGSKIRNAQIHKIPFMLIIGKKEREAGTVSVRTREGKQTHGVKLEDFLKDLKAEIDAFS